MKERKELILLKKSSTRTITRLLEIFRRIKFSRKKKKNNNKKKKKEPRRNQEPLGRKQNYKEIE